MLANKNGPLILSYSEMFKMSKKTTREELEKIIEKKDAYIKELEKRNSDLEEKYNGIFYWMGEAIQICELIFDDNDKPIDNILLDVNPAYEKETGLSREQVIGRRITEILPVVEQIWLDRYGELIRTRKPIYFEEFNTSVERWFEVYASPMRGNQFIVVFRDISNRKIAEQKLKKSQHDLKNAEKLGSIGNWEWIASTDSLIWSDQMYHIMGVQSDKPPSKDEQRKKYHPDDVETVYSRIENVFKTGRSDSFEARIVTKDNAIKYIFIRVQPITNSSEVIIGLFGIFQDITERKQLEQQLHQAKKMESIGQLAGGIAHDFNNILYPIIGFTQLSQNELAKDHPVQENLTDILDGAKRARDLVKRILHFSRQKDPELKPTILQPVINETLKLLRSTIPSNINLTTNFYDGQDAVLCDDSEIHEILLNLCTNAYHAIAGDNGVINITLDRQNPPIELDLSHGKYLCLSVKDNGVGIPEKIKDKIFEPYVTTKDVGKGTGLGLSVVYGIIKSYKGGIKVESSPETGTIFEIFLAITNQTIEIEEENAFNDPNETVDGHILFIDDEESIVKLGVKALKNCGYRVTGITDSTKALEMFKANPDEFDLVITDMAMPGIVGSELTKRILDIRSEIPIIICSGYSERLEKEKAQTLNVSAFLDKPLSLESLVKITREVLDQRKI